jgi:hypothetical protein
VEHLGVENVSDVVRGPEGCAAGASKDRLPLSKIRRMPDVRTMEACRRQRQRGMQGNLLVGVARASCKFR